MAARLARVESRSVTYMDARFPVFWSEAGGSNVRDADGNVYVDLTGAFGVAAAGHAHPAVTEALRVQSARLVHGMGDVHPPVGKVELLERLCASTPWTDARGILASTGSEAVEIALKTAELATGRSGVVAFEGGYHGMTFGALSVTSRDDFRVPFRSRLFEDVSFVPFPGASHDGLGDAARSLAALDEALAPRSPRASRSPGAVIVEPIQGRGGVRIPPAGFLAEVARRTRQAGALLVFDEVFTGFGRTGTRFAFEAEGVTPDVLCVGKALGGGLPVSCCLGPAAVMDAWPRSAGEALHTSTFLGHPLSCASALAFLNVLDDERLIERSRTEGDRLRRKLGDALGDSPRVRDVRGRGMFIGVELTRPSAPEGIPDGRARENEANAPGAGADAAVAALQEGVLVLPAGLRGEVVEITPPFTISRRLVDESVDTVRRVVESLG